jgi:hypothetical protein
LFLTAEILVVMCSSTPDTNVVENSKPIINLKYV